MSYLCNAQRKLSGNSLLSWPAIPYDELTCLLPPWWQMLWQQWCQALTTPCWLPDSLHTLPFHIVPITLIFYHSKQPIISLKLLLSETHFCCLCIRESSEALKKEHWEGSVWRPESESGWGTVKVTSLTVRKGRYSYCDPHLIHSWIVPLNIIILCLNKKPTIRGNLGGSVS